jgi:hypothetical protein
MVTYEEMVEMIEDQRLPFTEEKFNGYIIRHFDPSYPKHLFKWHWDEEDRTVEVLNDSDWRFQYDNELPIKMSAGDTINIPKGIIHRIIKGTTQLSLKIIRD